MPPSLNPSAATFPFPASTSPTISNASQTSTTQSSWTSLSSIKTTSSESKSLTPQADEKKIEHFGQGWISGLPGTVVVLPNDLHSNKQANTDPTLAVSRTFPARTRSPSLPILPSHLAQAGQHGTKHPLNSLVHDFNRLELGQHQRRQGLQVEVEGSTFAPFDDHPGLMHQASTPNFATRGPRKISSVRFVDELGDVQEEDELHKPLSHGELGAKLGSRSMPTLNEPTGGKNVYIASIPSDLSTEALEEYASQFGQVLMTRCQKVEGAHGGSFQGGQTSRHCGFVLFDTHEQARGFIGHLTSKGLISDYAKEDFQTEWKSLEDRESSNLYIAGLPLDVTEAEVRALLGPFGKVCSLKILDADGNRRGPIMARLECRPQADAAIKALNGKPCGITRSPLQVRIADSDGQKKLKRQASLVWSLNNSSQNGDKGEVNRRSSMPASAISQGQRHPLDELEGLKQFHLNALRNIEARQLNPLSHLSPAATAPMYTRSATFTAGERHRSAPSPIFTAVANRYPVAAVLSNECCTPTLAHTPSTARSTSLASSQGSATFGSGIWSNHHQDSSPVKSTWPNEGSFGGGYGSHAGYRNAERIQHGIGLHHAKSSPELKLIHDPAKLLWPGATDTRGGDLF